jgi:geranylgeranylglycerol-phosphate geranylgeranyltransferase
MLKRLLVSFEIFRPHNMLVAAFGVVAGYVISGGRSVSEVWPTALFTALVTGAGNVINDYHDVHIDRINKPRRPLPSQRLTPKTAAILYAISTLLITAGAALWLPPRVTALVVVWQVLLHVYARWAKRVFILGNLLVAAVASSAFGAGGLLTGHGSAVVLPIGLAFVFVLSRELVKGAEDLEGDREAGVGTAAVVVGLERAVLWAAGMMLFLAAAMPVPALANYYGTLYLWVMEVTVVPGLLVASYLILRNPNKRVFNRVSWILKVGMFFGVLAMALGKM